MLLLTSVLLILVQISCMKCYTVGSVLFYNHRIDRSCWTQEDLAKLRARQLFENICLPVAVPPDKINKQYIKDVVKYFRKALLLVNDTDELTGEMIRDALADAIGAHLNSEILPNVRMAYYAGYIPFKSANYIHDFHEEIKKVLNTQGLGWRTPSRVPKGANLTVSKIVIGSGKLFDPCASLITKHDSNGCIHLLPPKFDDSHQPSAIAMPFKSGGFVSLSSPRSENILVKYYTSAARCILNNSPEMCRHSDFINFNNELWHWMKREIAPHLVDPKLYTAFGGALRVAAAVQNYGKGPSKRNPDVLEDIYDEVELKTHPWIALTQPHMYVCSNWTPALYVGLVLVTSLVILCLQMSYDYIFGNRCCCHYPAPAYTYINRRPGNNTISARASTEAYRTMSGKDRTQATHGKSDTTGQIQAQTCTTQQVYDFNENKEKLMSVIMSEYESSLITNSSTSETDTSNSNDEDVKHYVSFDCKSNRTSSPPKIQAPMAELKILRTCKDRSGIPSIYATSIVQTQSEITTYRSEKPIQRKRSARSAVATTSDITSTESTTSGSRRYRKSRDSSWSRTVVAKKNSMGVCTTNPQSTGATEVD